MDTGHWSEWVVIGIFAIFVLAAIGHLIQVFTGPNRLRAFILALITPAIGAVLAVLTGALLLPGGNRTSGTQQTSAPPLPVPEWAEDLLLRVENWIDAVDLDVVCVALEWQQRRYIHCSQPPYKAGKGMDYIFRLKEGVLYPENGTTMQVLQRLGQLPRTPNLHIEARFLRDGGPMAMSVFEEIRRRLKKPARESQRQN